MGSTDESFSNTQHTIRTTRTTRSTRTHNTTTPQHHNTTTPQHHNTTRPQDHKTTRPQDHKTTRPQDHNTTTGPHHTTPHHTTTRHDTTRHDTTRHDTTRHDTTRHDTTHHTPPPHTTSTPPHLHTTHDTRQTPELLPEVLAGLHRRVIGRLLCVARQRPDVQQAVKELARGMSAPTNITCARLKRVMRYLVNKRTSIWKFEPTASEARDNELTATSDSDFGGCVKTRKNTTGIVLRYAGCTIATRNRTQGCISPSSAEAEYHGMVSALALGKQIQEILSEYHEDTHIILETDSSAAKANAERPGCGKIKHISVKYRYLQDAITNQEVWLQEVGTKHNVADGLTKTVNQHVLRNMLTTLKIELLETSKEKLSINLIDCKNKLMGAEDSDAGSPWRQSKCWTQEHREGFPRNLAQEDREGWPRNLAQEDREGWPRKLAQDYREGWPRKLAQEHREGWPRKLAQEITEKIGTRTS